MTSRLYMHDINLFVIILEGEDLFKKWTVKLTFSMILKVNSFLLYFCILFIVMKKSFLGKNIKIM